MRKRKEGKYFVPPNNVAPMKLELLRVGDKWITVKGRTHIRISYRLKIGQLNAKEQWNGKVIEYFAGFDVAWSQGGKGNMIFIRIPYKEEFGTENEKYETANVIKEFEGGVICAIVKLEQDMRKVLGNDKYL